MKNNQNQHHKRLIKQQSESDRTTKTLGSERTEQKELRGQEQEARNPDPPVLRLWHRGSRWIGRPEIRPAKKGNAEYGCGLYFTNDVITAAKYGRTITLASFADSIGWLGDTAIPSEDVLHFLKSNRFRNKDKLIEDIQKSIELVSSTPTFHTKYSGNYPLRYFLNLCVNNENCTGKIGMAICEFLVACKADAEILVPPFRRHLCEHWVVVFNPEIITNWETQSSKNIGWGEPLLPVKPIVKSLAVPTGRLWIL